MTRKTYLGCPVEDEGPDPCPKCGATVEGNDPVNGVCQADKLDAVVITDAMVERARDVIAAAYGGVPAIVMKAALEAALRPGKPLTGATR